MKILGIETSCDETGASVVEDGRRILSNVIASQVEIHARFGGIVPEVASRQHVLAMVPTVRRSLEQASVSWSDISAIAVTAGPGLIGSLLVGANFAKALAMARGLPLVGVNHLEAHIYANWLEHEPVSGVPSFPLLCLIVSGGHSDLVLMKDHGDYTILGRSRDDAAGEAFDKAARALDLGYPGGPAIQKAAEAGRPSVALPRAWIKGSDDFSFSGLKTSLVHLVRREGASANFSREDVASSFQHAVVDVLVRKTLDAAKRHEVKQILLAGGVAANSLLRARFQAASPLPVRCPAPVLCTDNAAMVAACGFYHVIQPKGCYSGLDLDVSASLSLA